MSIPLELKKLIDVSERSTSTISNTGIVPTNSDWMLRCFKSVPRSIGVFRDLLDKIDIIENVSGDFNYTNMTYILNVVTSIFLGGTKNEISRPVHTRNYKRTIYDRRSAGFGFI